VRTGSPTSDVLQPVAPARWGRRFERSVTAVPQHAAINRAFFFLLAFFVVYCSRPEEWVLPLRYVPVAKITAGGALLAFFAAAKRAERKLKDLPRESNYLLALIGYVVLGAFFSPVWKGGAFSHSIEFAKVYIVFLLIFLLVTDVQRLRRVILVQSVSVVLICAISVAKGHSMPRLQGVIGGMYSNPNDLAFAIVLTIPFCLAFLLSTKNFLWKLAWSAGLLITMVALFLTASRAGFIDLVISGAVWLWHFGIRGRRLYLIVLTAFLGTILMATAGKKLVQRFEAIEDADSGEGAHGSYEARKYLMKKAAAAIVEYPIFGIGVRNFTSYSGDWHEVHMAYLQIACEGGIPAVILYLLFFGAGFRNLRILRRRKDLPPDFKIYIGAVHSSLVGFVVGALFAPEAYQFYPYFAVAYTSAMVAMLKAPSEQAVPVTNRPQFSTRMNRYGSREYARPSVELPR